MCGWVLRLGLATMGGLVAAPLACTPMSEVFTCASDSDCTGDGAGTCQSTGFCAFPDAMCESGSRYGELAGGGFANMCVPPEDEGGTGAGTDSGQSSASATTVATSVTSSTSTTAALTSQGSSTETGSSESTSTPETGDSTGPATCEVLFVDEFDDNVLSPDWEFVGTGQVAVVGGTLELTPTIIANDSPTWVRRASPVSFAGMWFRVELDNLPSVEGFQTLLSVAREDGTESFDIAVDDGFDEVTARARDARGFTNLNTVPYDKFDTPWIGLREADGRLYFERGEDPDTLVPFFEIETDVSDWIATLSVGADNVPTLDSPDEANIESASACSFP